MKRKKITALAACFLLGAALLVGCGEEEPVPSGTEEVTVSTQEQTAPEESQSTEPTITQSPEATETEPEEPASTEPTETETTEPAETESVGTEPEEPASTEPVETEPVGTEPEEPASTEPTETEATEPVETEPVGTEPMETTPTEPAQTQPPETTPVKPPQTVPLQNVCSVETIYGELHFQDQWSSYMQIRQEQEGDTVRVYFLARLNDKDYPLFDLTISPNPGTDGQLQLTDVTGGKHGVEVNMEEAIEHEELDSTGQEILYSMQEQVNFIIENLT